MKHSPDVYLSWFLLTWHSIVVVPILFEWMPHWVTDIKLEALAWPGPAHNADAIQGKFSNIFYLFQIEISSHSLQFQNVTDHSLQAKEKKTETNLWQLREQVKCDDLMTLLCDEWCGEQKRHKCEMELQRPQAICGHCQSSCLRYKRFIWWDPRQIELYPYPCLSQKLIFITITY